MAYSPLMNDGRKIIHVDMDCFYAAVECKYRPELRGKPLGIGGPPDSRSVLCTASYEARKFGVHAAMPSSQALRLCPQLVLVPPQFPLYKRESQAVRNILGKFTQVVEPLSLDEAYLDVTQCKEFRGSATLMAREIRRQIFHELHLTASAGVASNKFLAKVASDWNKPNGQFVIPPNKSFEFASKLKVRNLFGVGKVTENKMHSLGLYTCADVQKWDLFKLHQHFGSRAQELYEFSRGIDRRPVVNQWRRRSLTVEETFEKDLSSLKEIFKVIPVLYAEWKRRMAREEALTEIRGAVAKIKFYDFKLTTHEISMHTFPELSLFERLVEKAFLRRSEPVRLIGLGVRLAGGEEEPTQKPNQLSFL